MASEYRCRECRECGCHPALREVKELQSCRGVEFISCLCRCRCHELVRQGVELEVQASDVMGARPWIELAALCEREAK